MPGTVRVKVMAGRDLPIMDRASETADAFVEIRFGSTVYKTDIYPKSLNPQWNSEWFKFEADDVELQDEPLQIRVMDYDLYSANDAIGRVYVSLSPLLNSSTKINQIAGWLPIFDTIHGIRGQICVIVKVDLFTDSTRNKQSSCGIDMYATPNIPFGYVMLAMLGFVEELVVNDDPEHQLMDKFRTPRASNEHRQLLFAKMSGELARKIGVRVAEMGGNAVTGYRQCFDLEGETGIVARGTGTAVKLAREIMLTTSPGSDLLIKSTLVECENDFVSNVGHNQSLADVVELEQSKADQQQNDAELISTKLALLNHLSSPLQQAKVDNLSKQTAKSNVSESMANGMPNSRSDDSISSFGSSSDVNASIRSGASTPASLQVVDSHMPTVSNNANLGASIDKMEFPFLTVTAVPASMLIHLGGIVCSRSVKLLDKIYHPEEPETRDSWWLELRQEIKSHMKLLCCNAVIGYREQTCIFEELCILTAVGTAAVIELPSFSGGCGSSFTTAVPPTQQHLLAAAVGSVQKDALHNSSNLVSPTTVATGERDSKHQQLRVDTHLANAYAIGHRTSAALSSVSRSISESAATSNSCACCHIPYSEQSLPFATGLNKCCLCEDAKVPEILLTSLDSLVGVPMNSEFQLIQARVMREKSDCKGEALAKEVSDMLPFVEHELHNQLVVLLRRYGHNAVFGLKTQIAIAEKYLVAIATATAVTLGPLRNNKLCDNSAHDCEIPTLENGVADEVCQDFDRFDNQHVLSTSSLCKNLCLTTLNSSSDVEVLVCSLPDGFSCCNLSHPPTSRQLPGLHMCFRLIRMRIREEFNTKQFSQLLWNAIRSTLFAYRKLKPICLASVQFDASIVEENCVQIALTGLVCTNILPSLLCGVRSASLDMIEPSSAVPVSVLLRSSAGASLLRHSTDDSLDDVVATPLQRAFTGDSLFYHQHHSVLQPRLSFSQPRRMRYRSNSSACDEIPTGANVLFVSPNAAGVAAGSRSPETVFLTPKFDLWPHMSVTSYMGHFEFSFIRETNTLKEEGGLSKFILCAICDILWIVRCHVAAVNADGLLAVKVSISELLYNYHRNHAQCFIQIGGDIVNAAAVV